ncbi:hypothetical protein SISNIDRAFT_461549 [Sistotremastrum niveocremeum HHB9708]|uniref:F-box domain-containing protein n=1 Tax=Sistotremastrum niveocremeum HHB9708 TaxID=1314777 RepID=A0A164MIV8_9AGAM|nr:hypothetical protein SISNIDRAFT_461549 [Sistotremastrum niveocremeum HHB9708]
MPIFSRLPPEILLHILRDAFLREITSRRLYRLVKNERIVWRNATDTEYLPLPTGHTIQTVPVELLFPIALRACSIAIAFRQPIIIPKRYAPIAPLSIGDDEMPYNVEIPGGRWTMYSTESGIRFDDSSKPPLENDTIISDGRLFRNAMGTMGEGVVRCIQPISTDWDPPCSIAPGSGHAIDIYFPIGNIGDSKTEQTPKIHSPPIPIPEINVTGVSDMMGPLILSVGAKTFDFLHLCDIDARTGFVLNFTGHNKRWFQIINAQFQPARRKVVLDVFLPGIIDAYDFAVWVFDIPEMPPSDAANASTALEFHWIHKTIHIQPVSQYIQPLEWNVDSSEPSEFPDTHVCVHDFIIQCPQFPGSLAMIVVCLTADDRLQAVCLGLFDRPTQFGPFKGRVIGATCVADNHLRIVCTDPAKKRLFQKTFEIPGGADLKGESMITRVDLVHGQVSLLRRKGRAFLDIVPCFVIQY